MGLAQQIWRQQYQLLYGPMRPCKHCWASAMMRIPYRLTFGILFSGVVCTSAAYADVADLQREVASSCTTTASPREAVQRLPSELAKYRNQIEVLEQQSSVSMQRKGDAFVQRGEWSESAEEQFFRHLVSGEQFQSYEKQRTDLTQAYMQMTEVTLASVLRNDNIEACKTSVAMVMVMKELLKLTEEQWRYMLSEKEIALAKTLKSSHQVQNAEAQPIIPPDLAHKAAQGR